MKLKTVLGKCVRKLLPFFPHRIAHTILFYLNHGYFLDWNNPKTYDEKMTWTLAYCFGKKEAVFADKYRVREYVKKCGYSDLLPKVYNVWDNAEEISADNLPNQFVLKANHGTGKEFYIICKDKSRFNLEEAKQQFRIALNSTIWKNQLEYHYKYIKPLVFAEEFLNDEIEDRMIDYKIHCFGGEPICILVCSNRSDSLKLDYYDLEWNRLDVIPDSRQADALAKKPLGLSKMIEAARKLSQPFPAARIDFYDVLGKVYFGEITLTPAGANLTYINEKWQQKLGGIFALPSKNDSFSNLS